MLRNFRTYYEVLIMDWYEYNKIFLQLLDLKKNKKYV